MSSGSDLDPDSTIPVPGRSEHPVAPIDLGRRVAEAQAAARVGTVVGGKWRIDRVLGMGGMAHVFAATHRNGRPLALKVLRPELAVEPLLVERFLREGYVANKVNHPGAVAVLDEDLMPDGAPFLVMELLQGRSLGDRLRDDGPLPLDEALRIADEVLDVLAAAHASGIIHRDIKPDNLFATEQGAIKVLDFGIARLRDGMSDGRRTQSGVTIGTLGYMAPEQARGNTVDLDGRTDVWAVGATLFTLLTGKTLHEASNDMESLLASMTTQVAPVVTLAPELPPEVCALLDASLGYSADQRFPDARAMQNVIRRLRRVSLAPTLPVVGSSRAALGSAAAMDLPSRSSPAHGRHAGRRRGVAALGVFLALGLAAGATLVVRRAIRSAAVTGGSSQVADRPAATGGTVATPATAATAATALIAEPLREPDPAMSASTDAAVGLAVPSTAAPVMGSGARPHPPRPVGATRPSHTDAPDAAASFDPLSARH